MLIITILVSIIFPPSLVKPFSSTRSSNKSLIGPTIIRNSTRPGSSDQMGDEWPMYRGALNRTGFSPCTVPVRDDKPIWRNGNGPTPIISNGLAYFSSNYVLYCANAITGTVQWSIGNVTSSYNRAAIADGRLYVGLKPSYMQINSKIACFNATTGSMIWSSTIPDCRVASEPVIAYHCVFFGTIDKDIFCYSASNGAFYWRQIIGGEVHAPVTVADNRIFATAYDSKLYCLDAMTGQINWTFTTGHYGGAPAVVAYNRVYLGANDNYLYCLNETTGNELWRYFMVSWVSSPAIAYGRIYTGCYCLDVLAGTLLWKYDIGIGLWMGGPTTVACGRVFQMNAGEILCANASNNKMIWRYTPSGTDADNELAIVGGRLYMGSYSGKISCFPMVFLPNIRPTPDLSFSPGMPGHNVTWTITEISNITDKTYTIYRDGVANVTGSWSSGIPITRNVDALPIGMYNYTIVILDGYGGHIQRTILVSVVTNVPPVLSHPADITYVQPALGNNLTWTIVDTSMGTNPSFVVYRNGSYYSSGKWQNAISVKLTIDSLEIGVHNFTIVASDGIGGSSQDEVIVTVTAPLESPNYTLAVMIACIIGVVGSGAIMLVRKRRMGLHDQRGVAS